MKTILVTGGAGFIGSSLLRYLIKSTSYRLINIDKVTYAGNLRALESIENHPRYFFEKTDICDTKGLVKIFDKYRPDAVIHLAAESHVDRSIDKPNQFINTNVVGTFTLLEASFKYWKLQNYKKKESFRFHHVSTDEVYGELNLKDPAFTEESPYLPNSPYSASKAASDHLVRAWYKTYKIPVVITNCSNNYGPFQYPEKLIPLTILNALKGRKLSVYGDGTNIRDWIYVDDHVEAIRLVLEKGIVGETYNIGGNCEVTNIEVVRRICEILSDMVPMPSRRYDELITFTEDRPGHDFRYAINSEKVKIQCGWVPKTDFLSGLRKTVAWYLKDTRTID